jgi:putative heme-binding domain-containing protein
VPHPITRRSLAALGCAAALAWSLTAAGRPPGRTAWLWDGTTAAEGQVVFFRKSFTAEMRAGATARLVAAADDEMELFVNGVSVLTGDDWSELRTADVTPRLKSGVNTLAVRAKNVNGRRAGLILRLVIESPLDPPAVVTSDESWKVSGVVGEGWAKPDYGDEHWRPASVVGRAGDAPWDGVTEASLVRAGRKRPLTATPAEQIKIKKGYKVELLYTVPRDEQGSWISLCADPRGRLYASDQYGGLYRVTPPPLGFAAPLKVEPVPVPCGEAHGLLWAFDSLYVVVNKGHKYESGLYRLRDTNGDDVLDGVEKLKAIDGNGEHGPHAVILGPDGKSLYLVIGNHTKLMDVQSSRVPRLWGEDLIVPRLWDARGHAQDIYAPGGYIVKTDPDGKNWELVSIGFRNCYDAAFNKDGELFTFDSDMEWDMNTPWYRPTRVCHVTSGSDFGWRSGTGKWPTYYPDSLPPVVEIGPGSPTGMVFGHETTQFDADDKRKLFLCDWSYGKLYAVSMTQQSSSFVGQAEEFLSAAPLPLTDICVSPYDRAMYFTTGGRKTTSGFYRITRPYPLNASSTSEGKRVDPKAVRHEIESMHGPNRPEAIESTWRSLDDADRFIRFAARTAIEHQDAKAWAERALNEEKPQAALTALLALARAGDKSLQPRLLASLDRAQWAGLSESQQLEMIRVYELALLRMGQPDEGATKRIVSRFDALFPANSRVLNSEICKLLAYLQAPTVVPKAMDLLAAAVTQEEQMDYVTTLRSVTAGWTPELRRKYFQWFTTAAGYRGGASFAGFVQNIKKEAVAKLSDEEKEDLRSILDAKPAATAAPPKPRPFFRKWTTDELTALVEGGLKDRDFDRGQALFAETRCVACHRFGADGGANGPDLTAAAGRLSVRDLIESIVEPNKVISDQYAAVTITTFSGKAVTGRIVNLTGDTLLINTDMFDPDAISKVRRDDIETQETSQVSMMPAGLIDTCTADEARDLIAFLLSKGDRKGPMFRK